MGAGPQALPADPHAGKGRILLAVLALSLAAGAVLVLLRERPRYAVPELLQAPPRSLSDCSPPPPRAEARTACMLLAFDKGCDGGRGDAASCAELQQLREALRPLVCVDAAPPPPVLPPPAPRSRGLDPQWPGAAPPAPAQDLGAARVSLLGREVRR